MICQGLGNTRVLRVSGITSDLARSYRSQEMLEQEKIATKNSYPRDAHVDEEDWKNIVRRTIMLV